MDGFEFVWAWLASMPRLHSIPPSRLLVGCLAIAGLAVPPACGSSGGSNSSSGSSGGSTGSTTSGSSGSASFSGDGTGNSGSSLSSSGDTVILADAGDDGGDATTSEGGDDGSSDDGGDATTSEGGEGGSSVTADGGDGGTEAGGGGSVDGGAAHTVCSQTWSATDSGFQWSGQSYGKSTAIDASGNILFAATLPQTSITIGGKAYAALGSSDGLLVKLDASCNVTWAKRYGSAIGAMSVASIAVDSSGNTDVVGNFQGTVSLGKTTTVTATPGGTTSFVFQVDPNGNTTWQQTFDAGLLSTTQLFDVSVDSSDDVLFVGTASGPITFGSDTVGSGSEAPAFLAKLDSSGNVLYGVDGQTLGSTAGASLLGVAGGANGAAWVSGLAANNGPDGGPPYPFVALTAAVDSKGNDVWNYGTMLSVNPAAWSNSSIAVDSAGEVALLDNWGLIGAGGDGGATFLSERAVHKRDSSGTTLWAGTPPELNEGWYGSQNQWAWSGSSNVSCDSTGNVAAAGEFSGSLDVSPSPALTSAGSVDVAVVVFDPTIGNVVRGARYGGTAADFASGVTLASNGDVVVGGWSVPASTVTSNTKAASNFSLFVAKLGW